MKSIKCPQCGLVNFDTAPNCKRCQYEFVSTNTTATAVPTIDEPQAPSPVPNQFPPPIPFVPLVEFEAVAAPIGGWLILFAIDLTISFTLAMYYITQYINMFSTPAFHELTTPGSKIYIDSFSSAITLEFIWLIVVAAGSVLLMLRFFKKSSSFPRLVVIILAVSIALAFIDYLMGMNIQNQLREKLVALVGRTKAQQAMPEYVGFTVLISILTSLAWIFYFRTSRRVESTFVC